MKLASTPDKFGCVGSTIRLASGEYIDLADPSPADITIYDIAVGLGNTCRFGGQMPEFYSVAEHSIQAADLAIADRRAPEEVFAVLMHDAAEAYVGDVVKPLKVMLGESFAAVERKIEDAIGERYGIRFGDFQDVVKHYDRIMLIAEKRFFVGDDGVTWTGEGDVPEVEIRPRLLRPSRAASEFVSVFGRVADLLNAE